MKITVFFVLVTLFFTTSLQAKDKARHFSIQEALESEAYEGRLNNDIKLYFGDQAHGNVAKDFGEYVTNRRTNGFGKADKTACEWALLSALLVLQDRAAKEGGNAVINIRGFFKQNEFSSQTEYECYSGAIMVGITLKGSVVRID